MKYCGKIGFEITEDKGDGIWEPEVIERTYYGDVMIILLDFRAPRTVLTKTS